MPIVTRHGDRLMDGDAPLRFVSFNIPNLHLVEDAFDFLGDSPWRWPDEFEITDALETIRQMNGRVVRCYVLSVRRDGSDMGDCVHVKGPGDFNEEAFATLDRVFQIANEKGVRVILPLVDNWKWWGGAAEYAAFRGKPAEAFWTDPEIIADFKKTIAFVINRRNRLTGVRYRDDPAILGWETGNEIDPPASWTREIAEYIKSLDPNHLVIDGKSLDDFARESLKDPNVDVITTHHYPGRGQDIAQAIKSSIRLTAGKKPYFVGEVGFLPTEELERIIDATVDSHASGVLLWSIRPHRREGGFYWHSEAMSQWSYKAYHWPGFASGSSYDETAVLQLARASSFRLRGEQLVPPPPPLAPRLLPTEDPSDISWQGSTGAAGYRIERSTNSEGPWDVIADDVSDAAIPYQAPFNDLSAEIGGAYYYRVFAKNSSGESPPSNASGPVIAKHHVLIDELASYDQLASTEGEVQLTTELQRTTKEDPHRAKLSPGASVTYQLPGDLTQLVANIYSTGDSVVQVEATENRSGQMIPLSITRATSSKSAANEYGYLKPVQITAITESGSARTITILAPAENTSPVQISRVVIGYASGK